MVRIFFDQAHSVDTEQLQHLSFGSESTEDRIELNRNLLELVDEIRMDMRKDLENIKKIKFEIK